MNTKGTHAARAGVELAWLSDGPEGMENGPTGLFWLGGFMSDMTGSKAQTLADIAQKAGRNCIRFDYSGHGASGGAFRDGTISRWLDEAIQMFTTHACGPRIVIGSSMGGWLALLLAKQLTAESSSDADRIAGMILIAPAVDMTRDLMWNRYDTETRQTIEQQGYFEEPSEYGPQPYTITKDLIEDGKQHLLLDGSLEAPFRVRILHGEEDPDVPWQHGLRVYNALTGPDISFNLIKSGDHRLSTERDLETLRQTCLDLCQRADRT